MKSIKIDTNKTGWTHIEADVKNIVAHFNDGHKEKMAVLDFLMAARKRKNIIQIDLYAEGEEIMEE